MKNKIILSFIILLIVLIIVLGYFVYKKDKETKLVNENIYNSNFYELTNYVQNVEAYLLKSTLTKTHAHVAETLTYLWREANLAQTYLSRLPIESHELEKTEKFLNQVSDYSYTLSRKCINGEDLNDEEIKNLEELHNYSIELKSVLNELSVELEDGTISWKDLKSNGGDEFSQVVSINTDIFSTLEENFHEYSGLIYDGAFSEHLTSTTPKGISGSEISEDDAKKVVTNFFNEENVQNIEVLQESQNSDILSYNFVVRTEKKDKCYISVSKIGGKVVFFDCNRDIAEEKMSYDEADKKAKDFLNKVNFNNMEKTYYLNQNGILIINYAYKQDDVIIYPDLIKVKVALDNGEILGIETKGYLYNHEIRKIEKNIISVEKAKESLNKNLDIKSEGLAIIPTEYKTEILCYEFKGKVNETEFLIYINAVTGKQEDILVIYNTPNGVLTL